jgi:ribose transport system substrate-binding protein
VAVSKPDALIVAPTDTKALNPELSRIASEGTKIVFVDTTTDDPSIAVSHITSNNIGGGELAAQNLAQEIGGKGTVAVIDVNPGISTTGARIQGFAQPTRTCPASSRPTCSARRAPRPASSTRGSPAPSR